MTDAESRIGPRGRFWLAQTLGWSLVGIITVFGEAKDAAGAPAAHVVVGLLLAAFGLLWSSLLAWGLRAAGALHRRGPGVWLMVALAALVAGGLWWSSLVAVDAAIGGALFEEDAGLRGTTRWHVYGALELGMLMLGFAGIHLAISWSRQSAMAAAEAERAKRLGREAELARLQAQLNPHFLFNALNSAAALVDEDPERAAGFIEDLGGMLRRAAETANQDATLGDELDFVERLLRCEHARFEARLQVSVDVPEALLTMPFPPLMLQPLVENAIKHGVERSAAPTLVTVHARDTGRALVVTVSNTGSLQPAARDREHVGLTNVRARLLALGHGAGAFTLGERDGAVVATLTLPIGTRSPTP